VHFQVLGPPRQALHTQSRNDSSLVIQVRYGPRRFLLTGDIEQEREKELAGGLAPADVLKVAHHGSRTSSGSEFLTRVRPTFAVISAGLDNVHGHPHREVLDRLTRQRVTVFRTDHDGMISFSVAEQRIQVETYRLEKTVRESTATPALRAGR
jgi:competence protein ComEC